MQLLPKLVRNISLEEAASKGAAFFLRLDPGRSKRSFSMSHFHLLLGTTETAKSPSAAEFAKEKMN